MNSSRPSGLRSAVFFVGSVVLVMSGGTLFWVALSKLYGYKYFLLWIAGWVVMGLVCRRFAPPARTPQEKDWARRSGRGYVALGGVLFGALLCEVGLTAVSPYMSPEKRFVPAPEWRFRMAEGNAYYWQGHLHRFNSQLFRGAEWDLKENTYRILVLGDSLTFGYGVGEEQTYPALIEKRLSKEFRVQVFNVGVSGYQSQDVVQLVRRLMPELKPKLVIYGMCLNDFLPSGVAEQPRQRFIQLPTGFAEHTALGLWVNKAYQALLLKLGIQNDFYGDILQGTEAWSERFENDMRLLNRFVLDGGLPPVLSLVLNQYPNHPQALPLTALAESDMTRAGLNVVSAKPYVWEFKQNGQPLYVSRWEGHPNARAHQMFADLLISGMFESRAIRQGLERYRK